MNIQFILWKVVLAKAVEDPLMLTQAHQQTAAHDSLSIGSALKQNLVEKLPVINTQVKFRIKTFFKGFCLLL